MGQKRRSFDAFARQRIIDKLDHIQRLHPGLSLEEMAAQIADLRNSSFNRRYFPRLKDGSLSDALTGNIVDWIVKEHDPHFLETLAVDEKHFSQAAVLPHTVISRREWIPLPREEALALAPAAASALGLPDGYCEKAAFSFRVLSFVPETRVLRVSIARHTVTLGGPLYLLERRGEVRALRDPSDLAALGATVDLFTLMDAAAFYFECVNAAGDFYVLASLTDLIYFLHEKRGISFGEASAYCARELSLIFEPPMVQRLDDRRSLLRIDSASGGELKRLVLEVTDDLGVSIQSTLRIAALPKASPAKTLFSAALAPASATELAPLIAILKEVPTGQMLARVFERFPAPVIDVTGPRVNFAYDEENLFIHTHVMGDALPTEHYVLKLAYSLRSLDQKLIGQTHLDPMAVDAHAYAVREHTKNLDALVHVCKIAIELQQTPRGEIALSYIEGSGLLPIFEAVRRGASDEEVFDAYASS